MASENCTAFSPGAEAVNEFQYLGVINVKSAELSGDIWIVKPTLSPLPVTVFSLSYKNPCAQKVKVVAHFMLHIVGQTANDTYWLEAKGSNCVRK